DVYTVRLLPALTLALAVISAEQHQRILIQTLFLQKPNQSPHLLVGKRNLSIVRTLFVFLAVGRWWAIRIVRIIQMHPQEKLLLIILSQPLERGIRHLIARAFHLIELRFIHPV